MDSKKKIRFLKILIMNKTLLLLIFTPIFLFSQIDDFQGFMDFTYDNYSGKIILNIEDFLKSKDCINVNRIINCNKIFYRRIVDQYKRDS